MGPDDITHAAVPIEGASGAAGPEPAPAVGGGGPQPEAPATPPTPPAVPPAGKHRRRALERQARRRPPGAYPHVERGRDGKPCVRYRTHMGQICRADTTPAEAVATWVARQRRIRSAVIIGRKRAARLGALLSPQDRTDYERLLRGQRHNVPRLVEWLLARGYHVSRKTVQAHRDHYLVSLLEVQESARTAAVYADTARGQTPAALAEAAAGRIEQLFVEMLFRMTPAEREAPTVKDWLELQKASGGLVEGRRAVERMRDEFELRARRGEAEGAGPAPTQAERFHEVCDRVRTILGVPLGDGDEDGSR